MSLEPNISSYKVLLVDDEENIVRSISRLLMDLELDLEVLSANSGSQGLEVLREHPDTALILSDQRMPGMSGAEFLGQARSLAPDAVRMVLTGYADMAATMDAINKGGAWRYLTKPWNDEVLLRSIDEGVEQYRLVQENRSLTALVEKQNRELSEWNENLKVRVMEQTTTIRRQNEELKSRNQQIGNAFRNVIVAFSRLIEQHSSRLQRHTANVTELSVRLAKGLSLPPEQVETVRTAALLHDIGVLGISPQILAKPMQTLTREELTTFMQHAVRGQTALDEVEELRPAGVMIRHHHECFKGEGFPDGLAGEAIPLGARIIAFADFIDREMDGRYGEEGIAAALEAAGKELGQQLDPAFFPLMGEHVREVYLSQAAEVGELVEKELRPKQLLEGMLVSRNLYTGSGLLLVARGTLLDGGQIANLLRHYRIDPPPGGIWVSWKATGADGGAAFERKAGAATAPHPHAMRNSELELQPGQLVEGMRISRNLYSGTGLLLLNVGTVLDRGKIVSLDRYYEIDPPNTGVFVTDTGRSS